jgi:hypothetical protein
MNNFADVVDFFLNIISLLIPLIFAVTLLYIVWNVIDAWIINGGEKEKIESGKNTIIVGLIALVIMSGIWGILNILRDSLF